MLPYIISSFALLASSSYAAPTTEAASDTVKVAKFSGPLEGEIFADPSVLKVGDTHYAFSTNHYKEKPVNVPMQKSDDLYSGWKSIDGDALPKAGDWTTSPTGDGDVWGPDVSKLDDGRFIMYYAAPSKSTPNNARCIGYAYAPAGSPTGPYTAGPTPIICNGKHGAIDANGVPDPVTGKRYIVWKNGSFKGSVEEGFPTISLQEVGADGISFIGKAQALDHAPAGEDGYEGPALTRMPDNRWLLLHTTGTWHTDYEIHYEIGTDDIFGNYEPKGPLLVSGDMSGGNMAVNPGAPDFVYPNNNNFVWAGLDKKGTNDRHMHAGTLQYGDDGQVKLVRA